MNQPVASHETEIAQLTRIFAARRAAGRRTIHAEDVRRRVVALTLAGLSRSFLAAKFGIASNLIWKWEQSQPKQRPAAKVVPIRPPQPVEPREVAGPCTPLRLQFGPFRITIEAQQGA